MKDTTIIFGLCRYDPDLPLFIRHEEYFRMPISLRNKYKITYMHKYKLTIPNKSLPNIISPSEYEYLDDDIKKLYHLNPLKEDITLNKAYIDGDDVSLHQDQIIGNIEKDFYSNNNDF